MSLTKRVIARLDVKGTRLIKGVRFEGLRVIGDASEYALRYAHDGADEILYVDAVASLYGRNSLSELLRISSKNIFVPITVGGGIRSVDDAVKILSSGADKVAVNTAAIKNPQLVTDLSNYFGKQCVVVSVQARRSPMGTWECMIESGREKTSIDVVEWVKEVQQLGAGEILLTSVDKDGTRKGPDTSLISSISEIVSIPCVASGGHTSIHDVNTSLTNPGISAVALGASLHFDNLKISELKNSISQESSLVHLRDLKTTTLDTYADEMSMSFFHVGIIDYGMGNQQSLYNALKKIGFNVVISSDIDILKKCDLIALPGVGSFPEGMRNLKAKKLDIFIKEWFYENRPIIGICLGMQVFFESGSEFELTNGLGLFKGNVSQLSIDCASYSLPHLGWNKLKLCTHPNIPFSLPEDYQYFVHSYCASDVPLDNILCYAEYGNCMFVAAVCNNSCVGFQFHPERSGKSGLNILKSVCNQLITSYKSRI